MENTLPPDDGDPVRPKENQSLKKGQALLGLGIAIGLVWLFFPKIGDPQYDPIDFAAHQGKIISEYRFGKITIAGKNYYDLDVIIFPNRVKYDWGGMKDHLLYPDEIQDVLDAAPERVIIGNGSQGNAVIMQETIELLDSKGIKTLVMDTYDAVELYNKLPKRKLVGLFHLTE